MDTTDKRLASLTKDKIKGEKKQNIRNETRYITTDPEDIKGLIREYSDESTQIHLTT